MPDDQLPHIVCVTPYVPHPGIDHAGGAYLLRSVQGLLVRGWAVTVLAPDTRTNRAVASRCPVEVVLQAPRRRLGPARRLLSVLRRATGAPSPVSSKTNELLRGADIIGLHWHEAYLWAPAIRRVAPSTPLIATVHDVATLAAYSERSRAQTLATWIAKHIAYLALRRHEANALSVCDQIYVFKPSDVEELRRRGCHVPTAVTPPVVDLPSDTPSPDPTSRRFVFSAAFWRDVNHQSALWLLDDVWPRVVARYPDAEVVLAGAGPRPELQARAGAGVIVTGFSASVVDGYRDCLAALAPVTGGAGLKFKVAQAVAMGYPIVGTTTAFDGFDDLVAHASTGHDTAASFADAIAEILDDPEAAIENARSCRKELLATVDFEAHLDARDATYRHLRFGS